MNHTKIEALFVDRDGTLIEDKHYLSDPQGVQLLEHVGESLKNIRAQGIKIFIVTNQSGIGRGYFAESDFFACQKELERQLSAFDVHITDTAFCPHDPNPPLNPKDGCTCRKPQIGMWEKIAKEHHLDASKCAMIGDKKEDVGFGVNAGFALSCLVATGNGLNHAERLGITFKNEASIFSASLLSDIEINIDETSISEHGTSDIQCTRKINGVNDKTGTKTQCMSAQTFADFAKYLLEKQS